LENKRYACIIIKPLIIKYFYTIEVYFMKNLILFYIIMQTLLQNKNKILEIKRKVENKDKSLYNHIEIKNILITNKTLSIIMTACNRSKQTYFTLQSINNSSFKEIQIIIVDDSDVDPINKEEIEKYPFYIDLIYINKKNKNWINPVVNYNIGFQYIKGSKVIIQNAEVCHIGDLLKYIDSEVYSNNYYVCDVISSKSLETNNIIYNSNINTIDIYNQKELFGRWYQGKERMANYHFLTAMTIDTFNKIKNFSYDYALGLSYDDDDFLLKIISNKINIINLFHDEYNFGGIHLWHISYLQKKYESNKIIFQRKKNDYELNGKYYDFIFIKDLNIYLNKNIDLLSLQNLLIQLTTIKIINFYISKKNMTNQINTFRKSFLKGYCYKNSKIKIPKNLFFKFYYT
jgi:hypothetical protein